MCRVIKVLERVHVNVIYITPRDLNGKNYIILFINEVTFIKWEYIHIIKSKAFDLIK
jgi:hypothetical protein